MNRLVNNIDLPVKGEPPAYSSNDKFIIFRYWVDSIAKGNNLEHASGFNSITIYIKCSGSLPVPVRVSRKTPVNLRNDHEGSIQDISLCAVDFNEEVFALENLPPKKSVRLQFVREGRYRLRYEFIESGNEKDASVDIVVG